MRNPRSGQGLIEFSLAASAMLLLFFLILDGGRLVYSYHTLGESAREGAHTAALSAASASDVKAAVNQHSGLLGDVGSTAVITPAGTPRPAGSSVTVTVQYTWKPVTPFLAQVGPQTLTSTTVVPVE